MRILYAIIAGLGRCSVTPDEKRPEELNLMRVMVIFFWFTMMSLMWMLPNYMGFGYQLLATIWLSLITWGGLTLINHLEHQQIRKQRLSSGRCLDCGYDLRGSPQQCPECGKSALRR